MHALRKVPVMQPQLYGPQIVTSTRTPSVELNKVHRKFTFWTLTSTSDYFWIPLSLNKQICCMFSLLNPYYQERECETMTMCMIYEYVPAGM